MKLFNSATMVLCVGLCVYEGNASGAEQRIISQQPTNHPILLDALFYSDPGGPAGKALLGKLDSFKYPELAVTLRRIIETPRG